MRGAVPGAGRRRGRRRCRGRGGASGGSADLAAGTWLGWCSLFPVPRPTPGANARLSVPELPRPGRERHRRPGTATATTAAAGTDIAGAGEGGRGPQPPLGQCPRRAHVFTARAPGPPVVPRHRPLVLRGPRGAAAPPPGPHREQPSDDLQQELLPAQRAGRWGGGAAGRSGGPGRLVAGAMGAWGRRGLPESWGLIPPVTLGPESRPFSEPGGGASARRPGLGTRAWGWW